MLGHLAGRGPGQRPPQVSRRPAQAGDHGWRHRVGLVTVGQRHHDACSGWRGRRAWPRRRWACSEHEITLPMAGHQADVGLGRPLPDGDHVRICRVRANASCRAAAGSDDRCADGGTWWRQTLSATAYTDHGRSIHERSASPRLRQTPVAATGRSVAVTNRRPVSRPTTPRSCVLVAELARFRAPRPLERGHVGDHCPVPIAATIAGDLPRYRRGRSANAPGDRPRRQASGDPA